LLTDKNGIPLSVVITAANTHDMKAAIRTLDRLVLRKRPKDTQNLCLDKGYDFPEIEHESVNRGYTPHIRHRREGRRIVKNANRVRRWVVERTNSWHNRFRKLLVRYEKKVENYLGLVQLACCVIVYRRTLLG
jgi:putative transposase